MAKEILNPAYAKKVEKAEIDACHALNQLIITCAEAIDVVLEVGLELDKLKDLERKAISCRQKLT